jgi:hemerythrin-like metal-binding protein
LPLYRARQAYRTPYKVVIKLLLRKDSLVETLVKYSKDREYIKWNNKYCVGISIIDEEHKKLIGIINKAIHAKEHSDNKEELMEVLYSIVRYATIHFTTEENYMVEFDYPEYQYHQTEHHYFSKTAILYCKRVANGDSQITNEVLEYLKQWLTNHIQGTDRKYIDCFKKNGLK